MFKIIKKSTFDDLVQTNGELTTKVGQLVTQLDSAKHGWASATNTINRQEQELAVLRTKVNACQDTKKYLKGQLEERFATIEKLKKQLAEAQFQVKVARKEVEIPTSSKLEKAAPQAEAVTTTPPAPAQKRKRTYTKRAEGKK